MIYFKSVLMGVAALVVSLILFLVISAVAIVVQSRGSGSGGIGATFVTFGPLAWIAAALIFAAGFWWEFRRASH